MKRTLHLALACAGVSIGITASAQRYVTEVFNNDQIVVTPDVIYGTNIDFLTSNLGTPNLVAEITALQTAVSTGQSIPAAYFNPGDPSTGLKVTNLRMDVYQPDPSVDEVEARPLVLYLHTGNALPPPVNGSPNGTRKDSTAVEFCRQFARRGYVAISMSYRLGWNPLAPTEQQRRGQLLNAIYRAIHDVRHNLRSLKQGALAGTNPYGICPDRIIVVGEGTGGYISLANATLDSPSELYIEKFLPDPFNPSVSYVDSVQVGNIHGLGGNLNLYRPNGFDYETQFCVNLGGALADTSWLAPGDPAMVAFHTAFDPFAPFTEGIVIVPTTGGPVVPVQGSNLFMQLVNSYGNNDGFASIPGGDPYTDRARALYGTSVSHGSTTVNINTGVEGLFPVIRPFWPAPASEEASPWQWWDPNSPIAQTVVSQGPPPITAHIASLASNPDMSPTKARAYIDTIMGYLNPRINLALDLGSTCIVTGVQENGSLGTAVEVFPNPAQRDFTISSGAAAIRRYAIFDVDSRLVRTSTVNSDRVTIAREQLKAGIYFVELTFDEGVVTRKLILE
jgi:hypothetical protein